LGTIFEQETGKKIFEEFKERIADPIGMEEFDVENCSYGYELELSEHPAYRFRMSTRDMARFGVLYQKNGMWNDSQIIPEDWITSSTTTYSIVDSAMGVGYGMLWDTIIEDGAMDQLLGTTGFYHTGVGVHVVMVIPERKLVLVQRYNTDNEIVDAGDIGMAVGMMIINSRISP